MRRENGLAEVDEYTRRTRRSARLFARARELIPGGVCHSIRYFPPYPFYAKRAKGSRIWDVDGNEYVDFWMGHGALILGHTPQRVLEAIRDQVMLGCQWGIVNELEVELAELVTKLVPCAEMVRFCNTGAEATMYACRLARGFTGRTKVAKIEGGWHGYNSDLLAFVHDPLEVSESLGLQDEARSAIVSLPFNDVEGSLTRVRENAGDLAAIIVEPVLGSGGFIPADVDYLRALREAADEAGCLLIFDEVITGFRLSPGGGQEYFGVAPDLATLGKILGGGMPIGAVVGREEVMRISDSTKLPKGKAVSIGGGTFSCNPISMRAGLETLRYLSSHTGLYRRVGDLGKRARRYIEANLSVDKRYVSCTGIESLFRTHFTFEEDVSLRSARDVFEKTDKDLHNWFKIAMANRGIFFVAGEGRTSTAHTAADLKLLKEACQDASSGQDPGSGWLG